MPYLKQYVQTLEERGNGALAQSVFNTSTEIGENYFSKAFYDGDKHKMALLSVDDYSEVISHLSGLICQAAERNFYLFLVLTKNSIALQEQVFESLQEELEGFDVEFGGFEVMKESDQVRFLDRLGKLPVLVLKKNARILRFWRDVLASSVAASRSNRMPPLFIIDLDDKAHFLKALIHEERNTSIQKNLEEIRDLGVRSLVLQVMDREQARLFLKKEPQFHPYFTYFLEPQAEKANKED